MWQGFEKVRQPPYHKAVQLPPHLPPPNRTHPHHNPVSYPGLSTARRIARVGCRAMPTWRGTFSRPFVGRDPRKGQGEIPGAEQSAPELGAIPGGHARQVPNRAPTHKWSRMRHRDSLAKPSIWDFIGVADASSTVGPPGSGVTEG